MATRVLRDFGGRWFNRRWLDRSFGLDGRCILIFCSASACLQRGDFDEVGLLLGLCVLLPTVPLEGSREGSCALVHCFLHPADSSVQDESEAKSKGISYSCGEAQYRVSGGPGSDNREAVHSWHPSKCLEGSVDGVTSISWVPPSAILISSSGSKVKLWSLKKVEISSSVWYSSLGR